MSAAQASSRPRASGAVAAWVLIGALAGALPAEAAVMTATQLNVYRDGAPADWQAGSNALLIDSFNNGNPVLGTNFTSTGLPASYAVLGAAPGVDPSLAVHEEGGNLLLDPAYSVASANALGQSGGSLRVRLLTNVSDPTLGLSRGRSFAATLRQDLSAMPDAGQTFGLRLNDFGAGTGNNDVIELYVSGGDAGDTLVFRKQDFDNGTITVLGTAPLAAPVSAAMLVLSLAHVTPDSDLISASYAYADAAGTVIGNRIGFANTATAFNGESHTRVEIRATGAVLAVPEPATWGLMAAGLGGLALMNRRHRAAG